MYLQITTKCTMACDHCCYSCNTHSGEHMSIRTVKKALRLASEIGSYITIGGGEPTIHPKFREILLDCIATEYCEGVHVITNGTHKANALLLAKLSRAEVIGAELSWDEYHDHSLVSQEVYDAFVSLGTSSWNGLPTALRIGANNNVSAVGSAEENSLSSEYYCPCEDIIIRPNGDVMACACPDAPCFGNVNKGYDIPEWYSSDCWRVSWEEYHDEEAPITYRPYFEEVSV